MPWLCKVYIRKQNFLRTTVLQLINPRDSRFKIKLPYLAAERNENLHRAVSPFYLSPLAKNTPESWKDDEMCCPAKIPTELELETLHSKLLIPCFSKFCQPSRDVSCHNYQRILKLPVCLCCQFTVDKL